jgi:hypothetical protein
MALQTCFGGEFLRMKRMTYVENSQAPNRYIPTRQSVWVELCQLCGRLLPLLLSLASPPLRSCWLDIRPIQLRLRWSMITLFDRGIDTLGSDNSLHCSHIAVSQRTALRFNPSGPHRFSFFTFQHITHFILRGMKIIKVRRNTWPLLSNFHLRAAAIIQSYTCHQSLL